MKTIYKGHEIEVYREKCLAGYPLIYYSVFRGTFEVTSGFFDTGDTVRQIVKHLKEMVDDEMSEKYLLQNKTAGYIGNSPVFWRKGGSGYTQWIDEAELWTKEDAERQIRSTKGSHEWEMWPESVVRSLAKTTVDIQDLRRVRTRDYSGMKLADIASAINEYLQNNKTHSTMSCYMPWSRVAGRKVAITYVSYQCEHMLTKAEAIKYLAWLDAGNVGRHYRALDLLGLK